MTSLSGLSKRDVCPICGQERILQTERLQNGIIIGYHCQCEREARLRAEEEIQKQEKLETVRKVYKDAQIPRRYEKCIIDNFEIRPEQKKAVRGVQQYIDEIDKYYQEGQGLVLYGAPGTGKTHLAVAVLIAALHRGYTGVFQNALELMYLINATYQDTEHTEKDVFDGLRSTDFLVLDDVGKGKWSETVEGRIYTLINARYSEMLPTIVTTNLSVQGLRDFAGQAVFDRLRDCCLFVPLEGESYRLQKVRGDSK